MSKASTSSMEEAGDDVAPTSPNSVLTSLVNQVARMNKNLDNIKVDVRDTVAVAVAPLTLKLDANSRRLDKLEAARSAEMDNLRTSLAEEMKEAIEKRNGNAAAGPQPGAGTTYAGAASSRPPGPTSSPTAAWSSRPRTSYTSPKDSNDWFWSARRCLRFFPVKGNTVIEQQIELEKFINTKLKISTGTLGKEDFQFVRRVKATKKSKINDELLVSFTSVRARDLVQSYARNLGEWTDAEGKPTAGIRMEVPERLLGDYKALEQYGHAMKNKHKIGFKRHIKIDDSGLCLYMDIYVPKAKEWIRVDMELVQEDNKKRTAKSAGKVDRKMLSTVDSAEEEEK